MFIFYHYIVSGPCIDWPCLCYRYNYLRCYYWRGDSGLTDLRLWSDKAVNRTHATTIGTKLAASAIIGTMTTFKPPKSYKLSKVETLASFEAWKHNQIYNLQADPAFQPFTLSTASWQKKSAANRGLTNDAAGTVNGKTAEQKCVTLNLMLDQIANWCPYISRTFLVKQCTSLNDVWKSIREHYGFLCTGGHFLDISTIKLQPDERPEDLYQRIYMFFEDNLISANPNRDGADSHLKLTHTFVSSSATD